MREAVEINVLKMSNLDKLPVIPLILQKLTNLLEILVKKSYRSLKLFLFRGLLLNVSLFCLLVFPLKLSAQSKAGTIFQERGLCSYYPINSSYKRKTANGESFDPTLMEGGHQSLPFGSVVAVSNPENGKTILIRINDRPYSNQRILDVTQAAADSLGFDNQVVLKVTLEKVAQNIERKSDKRLKLYKELKPTSLADNKNSDVHQTQVVLQTDKTYSIAGKEVSPLGYGLQFGSFSHKKNALKKAREVKDILGGKLFIQVVLENGASRYRVLYNTYASFKEATTKMASIKKKGYDVFVRKHLQTFIVSQVEERKR